MLTRHEWWWPCLLCDGRVRCERVVSGSYGEDVGNASPAVQVMWPRQVSFQPCRSFRILSYPAQSIHSFMQVQGQRHTSLDRPFQMPDLLSSQDAHHSSVVSFTDPHHRNRVPTWEVELPVAAAVFGFVVRPASLPVSTSQPNRQSRPASAI